MHSMVSLLGRAAEQTMMTDAATGTRGNGTTYSLPRVKFQRMVSGLGSADEQDATDAASMRATLYCPIGSPPAPGHRIQLSGETHLWFVLDEDNEGTERAVQKVAMMRQQSASMDRSVTIYRLRADGTTETIGPFTMQVNYDNRVAREVSTTGGQVRRVDGVMAANATLDINAGDAFVIDMGGGASFSGIVVDVNRSIPGRTEATISVQRGLARTPQRFG